MTARPKRPAAAFPRGGRTSGPAEPDPRCVLGRAGGVARMNDWS